jgi:hypothetical protein
VAAIRQRLAKGTTVHADESPAWNPLHASFAMQRINHQDAVMSVFNKLAHKSPSGFLLPVDSSDAGMRGGGRALSDG